MNFKRPSFRRGGSTGIGQLTPRKNFQFGTPGFNYLEPGLQNELRTQNELRNRPGIGTRTVPGGRQNIPTGGLTKGSRGARLISQLRGLSVPSFSTTGIMAAPFAIPAGLAYMNKPETLAEKKVMQDYGPIDETFFDYDKYYADREEASKVGDKISFSDALFMDPETGLYPKMFGRTEDRNKQAEIKKQEEDINIDMRGDPAQFSGEDELTDFDAIVKTMVSDKKTKPDTGEEKPEPTFEDTYQTEFDRIQKLVGGDNTKGMTAIALSEAINTPGTIADKAAVLNKSLLGIMGNKRKDKKEIAMLAYKATKEIEKAKIAAGKLSDSAKNFEELKSLNRIIQDDTGTYSKEQKRNAENRLKVIEASIRSLNPAQAQKNMDPAKAVGTLEEFNKAAKKLAKMDKADPNYARSLEEYKAFIELLNNYPELMTSVRRIDASTIGALGKKDGGRIERALGSPETGEMGTMPMSQTTNNSETPTAQVSKLSFQELRDRLPPEVTDDVIRFLSQSEQALQDFAYIRTAGDIKKFNMKYGLNLVLPAQA